MGWPAGGSVQTIEYNCDVRRDSCKPELLILSAGKGREPTFIEQYKRLLWI